MHKNAQKVERKSQTLICCHYTGLLHGENCPSQWRFPKSFLTASKPSRRSIIAAKRKEKEKKERPKKIFKNRKAQSRSQSLVPFDQRSENESSGSNHFEITKEITEFWLSGSLRICIYGACLKWLLPELSIPAAGQKDRRLWGRECEKPKKPQNFDFCACPSQNVANRDASGKKAKLWWCKVRFWPD